MTEELFFCQKSYGNTTRFYTQKKTSYRSGHIWSFRSKTFSVRSKTFLYDSIWLKNFNFWQKSYGNKTRVNFFIDKNVFKITVPGPGTYSNENLLWYEWRPSYMLIFRWGNFYLSKLLWTYNDLKFIFERFFRLCFDGAENRAARSLWVGNFPVSTDFSYWHGFPRLAIGFALD